MLARTRPVRFLRRLPGSARLSVPDGTPSPHTARPAVQKQIGTRLLLPGPTSLHPSQLTRWLQVKGLSYSIHSLAPFPSNPLHNGHFPLPHSHRPLKIAFHHENSDIISRPNEPYQNDYFLLHFHDSPLNRLPCSLRS